MMTSQKATIWANVDLDLCHHMELVGRNELNQELEEWYK